MELTLWTTKAHLTWRDSRRRVHAGRAFGFACAARRAYADLLFTMIEREGRRPPVTWTTFQARDLGSSTAEMVIETLQGAYERYQPQVLLVAESCG